MEIPSLGVELELQQLAYVPATAMLDLSRVCDLHHSSRQHWMFNPLSEARDQTRILMLDSFLQRHSGNPLLFFQQRPEHVEVPGPETEAEPQQC